MTSYRKDVGSNCTMGKFFFYSCLLRIPSSSIKPVELEIKDTIESNTSASHLDLLLSIERDGQLHTSIYDKRDDFSFHITNFPISPPMASLFRSLYDMPGLAPLINVLFWGRYKLLEQGYVKERLKSSLRKFYGRYGDLIKQYEVSPLTTVTWAYTMTFPTDQTLYRTRLFTEFWEVSIEHLRRVWHAGRGRLLLRTPGPVPLGLAYVLLVETNPFSEFVAIFTDYALRISLGTFLILPFTHIPYIYALR